MDNVLQFYIRVLWMHGGSVGWIGRTTKSPHGVIRGIVHRHFPTPRSRMSTEDRQAELDRLKGSRLDGGRLPDKFFKAVPISDDAISINQRSDKVKQSDPKEEAAPDPRTKAGRAEIKRRKRLEQESGQAREAERLRRESGFAERRGIRDAALEYLDRQKLLADPELRNLAPTDNGQTRRFEAGLKLRAYIAGSRIGGMGAVDFERVGSGGKGVPLPVHRMHCIGALTLIRRLMTPSDFSMIEAIVDRDEFLFDRVSGRDRLQVLERIRCGLDRVAVYEKMLDRDTFAARWSQTLPDEEQRFTRARAKELSTSAAELIAGGRR